jgi:hypothetical protein
MYSNFMVRPFLGLARQIGQEEVFYVEAREDYHGADEQDDEKFLHGYFLRRLEAGRCAL